MSYWQRPLAIAMRIHFFILVFFYFFVYYFSLRYRWLSFWPVALVAIVSYFFSWWYFKNIKDAVLATLILSEIAWALSFLPIGPFSLAGVLLLSYFVLTEKGSRFSLIIFGSGVVLIFLTSNWFL